MPVRSFTLYACYRTLPKISTSFLHFFLLALFSLPLCIHPHPSPLDAPFSIPSPFTFSSFSSSSLPFSARRRLIAGGQEVGEAKSFPFLFQMVDFGGSFCGATLLNEWWAVTAAHCLDEHPVGSYTLHTNRLLDLMVGRGEEGEVEF